MATVRRAVELVRTLRSAAGIKVRQPLARLWLALPGGDLPERAALLELLADEVNVKAVELIGDESALVERRVKPLLPVIGRKYGDRIPAIMAAARSGAFEITRRRRSRPGRPAPGAGRGRDPRRARCRARRSPTTRAWSW